MFLIVDDSQSFRDLLRLQLGSGRTETAETLIEGLRMAQALQPAVILLDNWFPGSGQTGIEALPAFRAVVGEDTRILILTADDDLADVARASLLGADGYMPKGAIADLWEVLLEATDITPIARPAAVVPARLRKMH